MRKLVAATLVTIIGFSSSYSQDIRAQSDAGTAVTTTTTQGTTPNLITSGSSQTWTGLGGVGTRPTDCCTSLSGSQPLYDPATNTIHFSYGQATVAQTIAINNALANVGAGVAVNGYNWSYDIRNNNQGSGQNGVDTLSAYSYMTNTANQVILSNTQTINTKIDWQTYSGTQTASTPQSLTNLNKLGIQFTGKDYGFWGGYYGPEVRNVNLSLNYGAAPIIQHTMNDDGWVNVPLQFGFPFYGKVFTNSFMFDNGVVGFFDPIAGGCNPANGYCGGQQWNSQPFNNNMGNQFSYMIAPLWADIAPNSNTKYLTQGDATMQRYVWENIGQYYDQSKLQTFGLEIKPSGFIGVSYGNVNLNQTNIGIGTVGNPSLGEYTQIGFHNAGTVVTGLPNWSMNQTQAVDLCTTNPLSSVTCAGYAAAYLSQQCSISSLYNPSCPGYATAYFNQQCTANPLYNVNCPGYASAYLDYQCSINPLYSTTCQGYETAYFNQQCSLSPLYSQSCSGYASAYHDQQCSINPLYATDCVGYASAYHNQQCTANPLYSTTCSGYDQAYLAQQCNLNGLYSKSCPNYATAYATKMLLEQQGTASTVATAGVVAQTAQTATTTPTTDSSGEVKVAVVADKNVNDVLTTTATSASPAQAATATVPLAAPPAAAPEPAPKKAEPANDKPAGGPTQMAQGPQGGGDKPAQPTARQQLAERRAEAAKKDAVEKGKNLANEMGKAADMESQKQVQNVVIQAMGFTPGFDNYNKTMIPDTTFYKPVSVYNNQKNIDNRANLRMWTGTDRLHNELVDSQYNKGN
jgi:hypothetical protein